MSELTLLIRVGIDIEAYCIFCNKHWVIPTKERAELGGALSAHK